MLVVALFCCMFSGMLLATGVHLARTLGPLLKDMPNGIGLELVALHGLGAAGTLLLVQRSLVQMLLYVLG